MKNATITGNTINGNYQLKPKTSCATIDEPRGPRVMVELDGTTYERTVFERYTWRNNGRRHMETRARFVIINGTQYEVEV